LAAVDATDCAIEGTVICASRAAGLVARAGSAVKVAASGRGGMARGSAGPAGLDLAAALAGDALAGAALCLVTAALGAGLALGTGTAFFATGLAVLAGIFLAGVLAAGFALAFLAGAALVADLAGSFPAAGFLAAAFATGLAFAAGFALAGGLAAFTLPFV